MYEMGLTGESTKFSDSVFYAGENTNTDLISCRQEGHQHALHPGKLQWYDHGQSCKRLSISRKAAQLPVYLPFFCLS